MWNLTGIVKNVFMTVYSLLLLLLTSDDLLVYFRYILGGEL